jgi:pimeloyl-ACP methyl ester carboxylesterase
MGRKRKTQAVQVGRTLATGVGLVAAATAAAVGGWAAYSKLAVDHNLYLPDALQAERKSFDSPGAGKVSYYVDRQAGGRPLLLVHSINAAASAFEMSPLFNHYRQQRPVFAPDLPGYGFSARSDRRYTPELYARALLDLIENHIAEPADVIALSLGSEFAARAALQAPEQFHSLTLISPTGFDWKENARGPQKTGRENRGDQVYPLLSLKYWEQPLYDLIASRRSIKYFLGKSFVGPVPPEMIDYAYRTAHQPGAQHAPLHFLSGLLFTPDVRQRIYELVNTPTLVLYDQDPFTSFEMLPDVLQRNNRWQSERLAPSCGLPHWEQFTSTVQASDHFWESIE